MVVNSKLVYKATAVVPWGKGIGSPSELKIEPVHPKFSLMPKHIVREIAESIHFPLDHIRVERKDTLGLPSRELLLFEPGEKTSTGRGVEIVGRTEVQILGALYPFDGFLKNIEGEYYASMLRGVRDRAVADLLRGIKSIPGISAVKIETWKYKVFGAPRTDYILKLFIHRKHFLEDIESKLRDELLAARPIIARIAGVKGEKL